MEERISSSIKSVGGEVGEWVQVSERPGREPFGREVEFRVGNLMWGKVHVRKEGDIYLLVISNKVFNWKDRVKDLKLKGEIVDAVGGMLWLKEGQELEEDLKWIKGYLESLSPK